MNRVQELIDENKEQMPTALAKVPLDACKQEADNTKQLYKLTWTMVARRPAGLPGVTLLISPLGTLAPKPHRTLGDRRAPAPAASGRLHALSAAPRPTAHAAHAPGRPLLSSPPPPVRRAMSSTHEVHPIDATEPILQTNKQRFVLFPIKYPEVWQMYKKAEASFWTAEEIDLAVSCRPPLQRLRQTLTAARLRGICFA